MKETVSNIWIEAEEWAPGQWTPDDDNTDVVVTLSDGSKWVASFFSYKNICSLSKNNRETGECLSGKYFWASDMILADEVSRERIEEILDREQEPLQFHLREPSVLSSNRDIGHCHVLTPSTRMVSRQSGEVKRPRPPHARRGAPSIY